MSVWDWIVVVGFLAWIAVPLTIFAVIGLVGLFKTLAELLGHQQVWPPE